MFTERINSWKKIIAGFSIFGFVLSFITGLFGDVVFRMVILRAFLFALLFGGIGILILYLIDTFIPELVDSTAGEDEDFTDSEENSEDSDSESSESPVPKGVKLDITIDDEDAAVEAEEAQDLEELESTETEKEDGAESVEELEEVEAADADNSAEPASVSKAAQAGSGGDLPDIEDFSDSFNTIEDTGNSEGLSSIDGMGNTTSAEILGGMHDTKDIIKAVQTVLKKDQVG